MIYDNYLSRKTYYPIIFQEKGSFILGYEIIVPSIFSTHIPRYSLEIDQILEELSEKKPDKYYRLLGDLEPISFVNLKIWEKTRKQSGYYYLGVFGNYNLEKINIYYYGEHGGLVTGINENLNPTVYREDEYANYMSLSPLYLQKQVDDLFCTKKI